MIDIISTTYNANNHCMLDIETVAKTKNSAMLSISAVQFNPVTGRTFTEFETFLDLDSQIANGQDVDHSTIMFWLAADDVARKQIVEGCKHGTKIQIALANFTYWMNTQGITKVWGKGPSFDCAILANAFDKAKHQKPWDYWNEFCVRSFIALKPEVKKIPFEGVLHNGLDDAKHQIKMVHDVLKDFPIVKTDTPE